MSNQQKPQERVVERIVYRTVEQERAEQAAEKRAAERAKELDGLTFPLLVVATSEGFFNRRRVRVGQIFKVPTSTLYSARWMKPAPAGAKEEERASYSTPRPRRSGENGNPDAPSDAPRVAVAPKSVI